jgi:hypothetical protein
LNFSRVYNQKRNKGGLWIALIFLFVSSLRAQSDYPINDPRNPNCPCHKYQKLAEEEYKKLLSGTNKQTSEPLFASNKQNGISDDALGNANNTKNTLGDLSNNSDPVNEPGHEGISSDDLGRINVSEGDNVLGKINDEPDDIVVSEQKMDRSGSIYKAPRYYTTKHWKGKHRRHAAFFKQLKRIFCVGDWNIWTRKRITSACYHWK